ncbi:eukaryotic translation initiation factor 2-alpha kinase [Novymonas esmeraldas]|uniref:non-specific serine/threonine protein kinase n=1 Tax=Novymonas esmeraldas TaxID=1808958 RepID=A0AAW0F3M9_9TRYP
MPQDALLRLCSRAGVDRAVGTSPVITPRHAQRRHSRGTGTRSARLSHLLLVVLLVALAAALRCNCQAPPDDAPDLVQQFANATEFTDGSATTHDVALHYTFPGDNLALLLTESGHLHAYELEQGRHVWRADVGGSMVTVTLDTPPSKEAVLHDPLALPFLVRGNSLFTRIPFFDGAPQTAGDASEQPLEGLPHPLRPYFFMNISTLLRRQTVFSGGTDVYVTTSVEVADLDVGTGRPVAVRAGRSPREGPHRGSRDSAVLGSRPASHNELFPLLHTVRYNIHLHAVKAGEYSWSIRLSQLRLSPRAVPHSSPWPPASSLSASWTENSRSEENPRFFSQFMRNMFDYDDDHVGADTAATARDAPPPADTVGSKTSAAATATARAAWLGSLHRRRTQAAQHVSHLVRVHQLNESHICLCNAHDGTSVWTSTVPHERCNASQDTATTAAVPGTTTGSSLVVAAHIWVSGAEEIFRVPVARSPHVDALVPADDDGVSRVAAAFRSSPAPPLLPPHLLPRPLTSASLERALVPVLHGSGARWSTSGQYLVPLLWRGGESLGSGSDRERGISGRWVTDDIDADEREETELAAYYHQCSWWEAPFLSSPVAPLLPSPPQLPEWRSSGNADVGGAAGGAAMPSVSSPGGAYSSETPLLGLRSPGAVVRTGLAWRTAAIISFHVLCLAGSIAFLCAGVPPRGQLQRAWAQADRNRDRLSHTSTTSRPHSTQLVPQDLLSPRNSSGAVFSPILDSFSVDSPGIGSAPAGSVSVTTTTLLHPEDSLPQLLRQSHLRLPDGSPPRSPWADPTPEQVYVMLRGESPETTPPAEAHLSSGPAASQPIAETADAGNAAAISTAAAAAAVEPTVPIAGDSSSDDDTVDIDLGERWWLRAQFPPRQLPSAATLDDTVSDHGSSTLSRSHSGTGAEEKGKLFQLHFKVVKKVGFGAEGSVFCVEHRVTQATYAIKVIHIHEQDEVRVVQEAVLHSSFDSGNVVRFYFCWIEDIAVSTADRLQLCNRDEDGLDTASMAFSDNSLMMSNSDKTYSRSGAGTTADLAAGDTYHMLFIQMEYFERGTLADWLRGRTGFFRLEVLRYMRHISDGIEYLHKQDVVHRDLKPTNIFVSNDNVLKIGDFGLAKRRGNAAGSTSDLTSNVVGGQQEWSVVGGSPLYCSPEQTRGDAVYKPSDIFSLGIIAVEMLCTFATLHERIRILTDAHHGILPAELVTEFPEEARLIRPMLAADPQQRPPIRTVLRQLNKLIVSLEALESDGDMDEAAPHSSPDGAGYSGLRNGGDAPAAAAATATAEAEAAAAAEVAATSTMSAPLVASTTATWSPCGRPVAIDLASSPLRATSVEGGDTFLSPIHDQKTRVGGLPAWQADVAAGAAAVASVFFGKADGEGSTATRHTCRSSASVVASHTPNRSRRRNTYHERCRSNASPNAEGETVRSQSSEVVTTGSASPQEPLIYDPYGLPTTPVLYSGDADLSTILKRDLQDRTTLAPD